MSTGPTPTLAPHPDPTPSSTSTIHPLLHEDIFPLILDQCSDTALARLMRVSRSTLADIIELRWPVITIDITGFHRPDSSRTSLPVKATEFSPAMTILLSRYAKMVRINPHRVAPCPPDLIWAGGKSRVRTLLIDRKGLCQSHDPAYPSWELPACEICSLFQPITLRIGAFVFAHQLAFNDIRYDYGGYPPIVDYPRLQSPILSVAPALSFVPTLARLVLFISLDNPGAEVREHGRYEPLYRALPAQVVDVVFLLLPYNVNPRGENAMSNIGVHHTAWLVEGLWPGQSERRMTMVGAERAERDREPEVREGATVFLESQQAITAGMARGLERYGVGLEARSRVRFVTLWDYLQGPEARSDFTAEEIADLDRCETARLRSLKELAGTRRIKP